MQHISDKLTAKSKRTGLASVAELERLFLVSKHSSLEDDIWISHLQRFLDTFLELLYLWNWFRLKDKQE